LARAAVHAVGAVGTRRELGAGAAVAALATTRVEARVRADYAREMRRRTRARHARAAVRAVGAVLAVRVLRAGAAVVA